VAAPAIVQSVEGNYCREFNSTAVIGGREFPVYGTMCRQPDGSWKMIE
jgi:surface antigen